MVIDDRNEPLFVISIVSKMLSVHPQTLRLYEREGLICPKRTSNQRLYSREDIEKIDLILKLTREMGVNKAGVDIILRMRERFEMLHKEVEEMMGRLEEEAKEEFEERIRNLFTE